jgi:hypothetical protein
MKKDSKTNTDIKKKNTSKGVKNYTKIKLLKQYISGNTKPSNNEPK